MQIPNAQNVFHHDADPSKLDALRSAVIDDIFSLRNNYPDFDRIAGTDLGLKELMRMRERYSSLLYYGGFSLPAKRAVANELIWKWTEATGKYVGCQFWSVQAKQLFDREVVSRAGGWPITSKTARFLEKELSKKSRPASLRLTHEHVYPIKDMKRWLRSRASVSRSEIENHFERHCIGCVVLEAEHDRTAGNDENPWLRYLRGGIQIAVNPAWSDSQRTLLTKAGVLVSAESASFA